MKRLLSILIISSCFLALKAQSFELYYSDLLHNNGDTIVVNVKTGDLDQQVVKIKNVDCCAKSTLVRKYEVLLNGNAEVSFCWLECYPTTTMLSPEPVIIDPNTMCENFSSDFLASQQGISYVLYTFFDESNASDSVCVYFKYNCSLSSISSITDNYSLTAFPNPAKDKVTINYTVDNNNDNTIQIYSINGKVIYQEKLSSEKHTLTLDVSNWASGIYMYSIISENRNRIAKKLIISK